MFDLCFDSAAGGFEVEKVRG